MRLHLLTSGSLLWFMLFLSCGGGDRGGSPPGNRMAKEGEVPMQIIITGPPGAGKGTQAKRIEDEYHIAHISTGEMLRAEVARGTDLGKRVKAIMERGELVSDEIMLALVKARLKEPDTENGFILDGFPRTIPQAQGLSGVLQERGGTKVTVIDLEVPEDELIKRMLGRGRADDTRETILERIEVYHQETAPLTEYYEKRGELARVDGNQSIEDVFSDIRSVLADRW